MAHQVQASVQTQVRTQFDRQVTHYLQGSPMADQRLLELILHMAQPTPAWRVLDIACGAGFLVCELAKIARGVWGIDLSRRMLHEARTLAQTLGRYNTVFCQGDAEALPFAPAVFDVVTCKLAFHYFPHPQMALGEMSRVATSGGRVVLVDRVSAEDPEKRAYQNRLERLRTPAKTHVYSASQLGMEMEQAGLTIEQRATYQEHMDVDAWIQAAGPDAETAQTLLALLTAAGDPAGLQVRSEQLRLMLTHQTCILVARQR